MRRNPHVDLLRGIAITSVLMLHFALAYGIRNSPFEALLGPSFAAALFYNGNYGVTMFFAVSGYLITSMSLTRWRTLSNIEPRAFYVYRFARIMPCLVIVLAVIVALGCAGLPFFANTDDCHHLPSTFFAIAVLSVLTFWHNVLMGSVGWFNYCLNIYWSLSVEEVFYLALPMLSIFLKRNLLLLVVALLLIGIGPVYRSHHLDNEILWECSYLACFDAINWGCMAAFVSSQEWVRSERHARFMRWGSGMLLGGVYLWGIDHHEVFGFTWVGMLTAIYLAGSSCGRSSTSRTDRALMPLRWAGKHSYELYLFHIVVLGLLRNVLNRQQLPPNAWILWFALFLLLSALVAALVSRYISQPANRRLRYRFAQ